MLLFVCILVVIASQIFSGAFFLPFWKCPFCERGASTYLHVFLLLIDYEMPCHADVQKIWYIFKNSYHGAWKVWSAAVST